MQELSDWLQSNHQTEERYDSIRRRVNDTYDSILDNPEFTSWRSESSISLKWLWVHGLPAWQRAVLCARIIEHIKDEKKEAIAYYFFSPDPENHIDPMVAIRSWIYQMALLNASVLDAVSTKRKQDVRARASQAVILELLQTAIKIIPKCTLVVDGLDEGEPSNFCLSVAEFIEEVNEAAQDTNTRVLLMSRSKMMEMEKFIDEKNTPSRTVRKEWLGPTNGGCANAKANSAFPSCYATELEFVNLKKGRIRGSCNSNVYAALGAACSKACEDLARKCLAIGAKVGMKNAQHQVTGHYVALSEYTEHTELIKPLIDLDTNVTIREHDGASPFSNASTNDRPNTRRRLIPKVLKLIRQRRAAMVHSSKQILVTTSI